MAERAAKVSRLHGLIVVTWSGILTDDTGEPYQPPQGYDLASMQFEGADGGGTTTIEGSNLEDQSAFQDITDSANGSTNMRAPYAQALSFRPSLAGGTGGDVDVHALFRQRS